MSEDRNADRESESLDDAQEAWEDDQIEDADAASDAPEGRSDAGDSGQERDSPETDSESEGGGPVEVRPPRPGRVKPTAREEITNLRAERRELRERLDRLELAQQQPRGPSPEQIAQQERAEEAAMFEQVAMLQPHEQAARVSQFYAQRSERKVQQAIQVTQVQVWDAADRQSYERELADNPRLQRFADQVEQLHRQYPGVSRIDLLDKAVGEATRRNLKSARTRQSNQAAAAVAANGARPPGGRSNVAAPARNTAAGRRGYEHMRNVLI